MKKALICFALLLLIKNLSAQKHAYNSAVIAFYNLENFYDTIKNPAINDEEFTPLGIRNYTSKIYWDKVEHLATVLSLIATDINPDGPAMIGVAEIENDTVLNDLIKHPLLQNRNYHFIHYDSKDARGVDVALLYNPKYLTRVISCLFLFQLIAKKVTLPAMCFGFRVNFWVSQYPFM